MEKPRKNLVYVLAEILEVNVDTRMQNNLGECEISPKQKIEIFPDCYM